MKSKLLLSLCVLLLISGCIETVDEKGNLITPTPTAIAVSEKLKIEDTKVGTGREAKVGDKVRVDYVGKLEKTGKKFESSKDEGGKPFEFTIGTGGVIPGWEQGIQGMKIGGTRKLTIPAELAYGEQGSGTKIPPNSTLIFTIDLLAILN